jgi:Ala-tRNA(Pro) deacylase
MFIHTLIKEYLDLKKVPYEHHIHFPTFTAQQIAAEEHVPGMMVAKTVVLKADRRFIEAVLPASRMIDMLALKEALGVDELRLASEFEFKNLFPDSELGTMPPFGNLYGIPVYVDVALTQDQEILFNAGTHEDTILMNFADFVRIVEPTICSFALRRAA